MQDVIIWEATTAILPFGGTGVIFGRCDTLAEVIDHVTYEYDVEAPAGIDTLEAARAWIAEVTQAAVENVTLRAVRIG